MEVYIYNFNDEHNVILGQGLKTLTKKIKKLKY